MEPLNSCIGFFAALCLGAQARSVELPAVDLGTTPVAEKIRLVQALNIPPGTAPAPKTTLAQWFNWPNWRNFCFGPGWRNC